ncbi:acyl-CoA dehydrogenase family protein [Streptomyces aureus]
MSESPATAAAVLEAVRALAPALRERAAEAEALRKVPDTSIKDLEQTGFFRLLQPRAYGGFAADPAVFYAAVREIARACGSTGWVASVVGVHPWHVALYDPRAQEEVGAPTRRPGSAPRTPRPARSHPSTAASASAAPGASPPAVTTRTGRCSAASSWTRTPGPSTCGRSSCRARSTASTTCGTPSACAAPDPTTSCATTCSCPSTAPSASAPSRP